MLACLVEVLHLVYVHIRPSLNFLFFSSMNEKSLMLIGHFLEIRKKLDKLYFEIDEKWSDMTDSGVLIQSKI